MIASVGAKPSHWMLVISSRISGWRVTDSITLPKMYPTPMPGPIVPRPAPTPRAIDLRPSAVVFLAAAISVTAPMSTMSSMVVPPLVTLGRSRTEVDGCEGCKDEGLKACDQADLEDEEDDRDGQREDAEGGQAQQHHQAAAHEQDQQVAGQDVGK